MATHEVTNRSTPLVGHDAATPDVARTDGLGRAGGAAHPDYRAAAGWMAGTVDPRPAGSDFDAIVPGRSTQETNRRRSLGWRATSRAERPVRNDQ